MEGAEGLLKTLKGLPWWIMAGLSVTAAIALLNSPLQVGLPASWRAPLPLATVGLAALTLFALAGHVATLLHSRQQACRDDDREKLRVVFAPFVALFVRRHVTACTGVGAPRFRHRVANAWEELFRYKRFGVGVRRAIKALSDRHSLTSAEVEYGGDSPSQKSTVWSPPIRRSRARRSGI